MNQRQDILRRLALRLAPRLAPFALLVLAACASLPSGPSIMALPGSNKGFDQFRADEAMCRSFASQAIGATSADNAAVDAGVRSAAVGTLVGAAAGAAIDGSQGAGVGAGVGLLFGSMAGVAASDASRYGTQSRYDQSYVQCMYSRGHRVPVSSGYVVRRSATSTAPVGDYVPPPGNPPPPPGDIPPPPAGNPPPPPLR